MARKRHSNNIEGQLSFDFCLDTRNYVVQANNLILGKQSLKLNSAKLIRAAIMQVVSNDTEFKPYNITISDLAKLLGVSADNMYRDIENITDDIIKNPVYVRQECNGKTTGFIKIPWVSYCEYRAGVGVSLELNEKLKPFLLQLHSKGSYTQYTLQEVMGMKSVYAVRVFELIREKLRGSQILKEGASVILSVQEMRECCDCEEKYPAFANFKDRVIDYALKEINLVTTYRVTYSYIKNGKRVESVEFHVKSIFNS